MKVSHVTTRLIRTPADNPLVVGIDVGNATRDFVTLELVYHPDFAPTDGDSPLSHLVIQVDDMEAARTRLAERGVDVDDPASPDGSPDFWTAMLADPDGNRIELVQWPPGHADGITAADQP